MKGNSDKCQFITSTNETHHILVNNSSIGSSSCNKLLGVKIDSKLTFDDHVEDIYMKANKKSISKSNNIHKNWKKKHLANSFLSSV